MLGRTLDGSQFPCSHIAVAIIIIIIIIIFFFFGILEQGTTAREPAFLLC